MAKTTKKTIEYLWVSTADQDIDKNKADILNLANEKKLGTVEWVKEKASGKINWRKRKIAQVIDSLKEGDTVYNWEAGYLARYQ